MKRTQIQLEQSAYKLLKNRAHAENRSMASVIRDAVDAYLEMPKHPKRKLKLSDFSFIGSGRSDDKGPKPLSVYHDDALYEIYQD